MKSIFTTRERKAVFFLALLFLVVNGVRLYEGTGRRSNGSALDLGTLEPADSMTVANLLERSMEMRRMRERASEVKFPIDLNRAEPWELSAIPGIGPQMAAKIVEERKRIGGFRAGGELLAIPGLGERTLSKLIEYIRPLEDNEGPQAHGRPRKVDINGATVRELESLPGIGVVLAARIVAEREANGPFDSLEDLKRVQGIGEERLKRLSAYLVLGAGNSDP